MLRYALNVRINYPDDEKENYPDDEKEINHGSMDTQQLSRLIGEYLADTAAGFFVFTIVPVTLTENALGVKGD